MKQISITECTVIEAMAQIDALDGLNVKDRSCLRLLTEEMFSMVAGLLEANKLDYEVKCEDKKYTLRIGARARVSEEARKHFLSMSTDGRNMANRGIKGILGAVMEAFLCGGDMSGMDMPWQYGMRAYEEYDSHVWMLSQYVGFAPPEKTKNAWDGMEKSIIASFSDDVMIGVRSGKLEMTVTKAFA